MGKWVVLLNGKMGGFVESQKNFDPLLVQRGECMEESLAVVVDNCDFAWYETLPKNRAGSEKRKRKEEKSEQKEKTELKNERFLKDINLKLKKGRLYGLIGGVGCGKSALLLSIQDKMKRMSGNIQISGKVSSIFQQPFLINDTVRNNILYFNQFDEQRYRKVLKISSLEEDLKTFPGGDMTEIGDNAANLSGGQRHRISIARALYENNDIYLIDDCLNALDNEIASSILREAFEGYLGSKTRLMVTNNNKILHRFDEVIKIEEGRITFQGSYEELCKASPEINR